MRPERLEVRGFTAFRETAIVDFRDAEVFAFTGPTGSGKSSLIDAIVFALYGSVPRYDDRRVVAPLITLGMLEALVRFDFSVEGRRWTAVRVVRRTSSGGASTQEARLESADEVVASGAEEVTAAVEALLGLGYEHFTKSVVLPQGEFARFLHDPPRQRQALLRSLLDVEAYTTVRELASQRAAGASERRRALEARISELATASEESMAQMSRQVETLERIHDRVVAAEPELERAAQEAEGALASARALQADAGLLEGLVIPDRVLELGPLVSEGQRGLREAEEAAQAAGEATLKADLRRRKAGDPAVLSELRRTWEDLEQARSRLEALKGELFQVQANRESVEDLAGDAEEAVGKARADLERARSAHAAHRLAAGLRVGEPCPVCAQLVTKLPAADRPADLEAAELAVRDAEDADARLSTRLATVRAEEAGLVSRVQDVAETIAALEERLTGGPSLVRVLSDLAEAEEASRELAEAQGRERGLLRTVERLRSEVAELESQMARLRNEFDSVRDGVAERQLRPPSPERIDLTQDWEQLQSWAESKRRALLEEASEARGSAARHRAAASALEEELVQLLGSVGVVVPEGTTREKVVFGALTEARHQLDRVSENLAEAEQLRGRLDVATNDQAVAEMLALHLRADRFESWLLDEAVRALVAGANHLLTELSSGAFSLRHAERRFEIVDHRNADETRSVRTLSGGETFLVSLSLALSLAEQLASMSSRAGATVETVFLDEGFGSLDRETLEVVGSVIHDLGAKGRIVGIVTHVTELAEQAPVRFEVTKGPHTASVTKVEA